MASSSVVVTVLLLLAIQLQSARPARAESPSFCPLTLSRPTCPDLPTYNAFDVTTYGGRWYEIGSSANFKNLQESGGICVVANYTLLQAPSPGIPAEVGVFNTLYGLGAPLHNVSQVVISLTAGQICSQAFVICAETDLKSSNLTQGLSLVSDVASRCSTHAKALESAMKVTKKAIDNIDLKLDELSTAVETIQELDSALGQGQGDATVGVEALFGTVAELNGTVIAIATSVGAIEGARESVGEVAAKLAADGNEGDAATLYKAAGLILAGEGTITGQLGQIQGSLASVAGVVALFLAPKTAPTGYGNNGIVGTAEQNTTFAGKLLVSFPGFPPGTYWVLAVEEGGPDGGYAATLVYGCDQNTGGGGIEETLFVLSRTPTLPEASVNRLLAKAAKLGVTRQCSTPFIFTVQTPSCGNPPLNGPIVFD